MDYKHPVVEYNTKYNKTDVSSKRPSLKHNPKLNWTYQIQI